MELSRRDVLNNPLYSEILQQQSATVQETRAHIERMLMELEDRRSQCVARRRLLATFQKDVTDAFTDCRAQIKKSVGAMINYLKQQQEEMLHEVDETARANLDIIAQQSVGVDHALARLEREIEEGHSLMQEQDMFLFVSKSNLFKQLPPTPVPDLHCPFKDDFPDLTALSIQPFQMPLQHAVAVDIQEFLKTPSVSVICGNILHKGFRFQLQLKHDGQHLSAYLCLRAWHDVAAFLRVTVHFTLALQDGPEVVHSASAKNTFSGRHDGWGWNKFVALSRLQDCTDVLFLVRFNELAYSFIQEDALNKSADMEISGDHLGPSTPAPGMIRTHVDARPSGGLSASKARDGPLY